MGEEKESVYGEREQKKLVAILIADDKNFEDIIKIIEPGRFDNPVLQLISKLYIKLYKTYSCKPDEEELAKEINKAIKKDKRLPEEEILSVLGDILDMVENPESLNYLREEFIEFAKAQKLKAMIMNGAERFKKKSPDELIEGMVKELEEAKSIGKKDSAGELQITNLGDVEAADVEWLWGNRIPLGKLSLIVGDPGGGKSFFTLFMASQITGGGAWPDLLEEEVKIGKVILLTAEDGLADTVRPRVDAMEGDPAKIIIIEGTKETGKLRTFNLAKDVTRLENLIKENPGIRVVIIDPISAYIGAGGKAKASSHIDMPMSGEFWPLLRIWPRSIKWRLLASCT